MNVLLNPAHFPVTVLRPLALLLYLLLCAGGAGAQEKETVGAVQRIATRPGVGVPIYAYWRPKAVATVVLFSGGGGGYGKIGADGWPSWGNFLIRMGRHWASHPFNVVMVGRPSDGLDLSLGRVRTGDEHAADNAAVFRAIRATDPAPLWVVGTSMGTISAAAAAIRDDGNLIAGVVLTSSIVNYKMPGAVPTQELDRVRVPTLIVHHAQDACWACRPHEVGNIAAALLNAPVKQTHFVSGGAEPTGNPCEPMHYHGFVGMQEQVVDFIAAWIIRPAELSSPP